MTDIVATRERNTWIVLPASLISTVPDSYDILEVDGLLFGRCADGRFMQDRCLSVAPDYAILIDGVLLNKAELLDKAHAVSTEALLLHMIRIQGLSNTLASLRGPFSGAVYDRAEKTLHLFGNHTGDTAAFVHEGAAGPLASNSADLIMRLLAMCGLQPTFNEEAALMMLSYGFMLTNDTFAQEVQRVSPGAVRSVGLGAETGGQETPYWQLRTGAGLEQEVFEDAVAEFDRLFRAAIVRCFEKDLEYGFPRHLADMSGGLDARMMNVVARDLGYVRITNVTYSESESDEARYAISVATQLGNECLHHPLDGGRSLLDPAGTLQLNSGMAYYGGITGGRFVLECLNYTEFGLEHTGQLGDVVAGSYVSSATRRPPRKGAGAYSRLNAYSPSDDVLGHDEETYLMRTRGFRGVLSTHLLRQHFTYAVSPFLDVDLLDYVFSLPLEWRVGHKLYGQWIRTYYPSALEVPSTRLLPGEQNPLRPLWWAIRRGVGGMAARIQSWLNNRGGLGSSLVGRLVNNMNPAESWYSSSEELRSLISAAQHQVEEVSVGREVRESLERSFSREGTIWDKLLAVTVTTMHGLYFSRS